MEGGFDVARKSLEKLHDACQPLKNVNLLMSDLLFPSLFKQLRRLRRTLPFIAGVALIGLLVTAASYLWGPFGLWVSEPRVEGMVIDKVTRKPIEGAIIAGHYVTTRTLGHGRNPVRYPKLFETVTDANGGFSIPSWKSDAVFTPGWKDERFLYVLVYKPGYQLGAGNGGGSGMTDWRMSDAAYSTGALANTRKDKVTGETVIDWTNQPAELVPARNDNDRYVALTNSGMAYGRGRGACDWESYARLIQVSHTEARYLVKRLYPPESLTIEGKVKSGMRDPSTHVTLFGDTFLETLTAAWKQSQQTPNSAWVCANLTTMFKEF